MSVNMRQAILSAADQIEQHPTSFNFMVGGIPRRDGDPGKTEYDQNDGRGLQCVGCAMGWISHFAVQQIPNGLKKYGNASFALACRAMPETKSGVFHDGDASHTFYMLMDYVTGGRYWRGNPVVCAHALRKYADMYHPATEKMEAPVRPLKEWLADVVPGTGHGDLLQHERELLRYIGYDVLSIRVA